MTFEKIAAIIADKLKIDVADIKPESTFDDLKADSLYIVEIMMEIEEAFDISLDDLGSANCVADIVEYVDSKLK